MYDFELAGADDALDLLGVGGEDYVGALPTLKMNPAALRLPANARAIANTASNNAANRLAAQVNKNRRIRQLASAGQLPQIPLGVRSAATVTAGGTETIAPEPSVPMRLTTFQVAKVIMDFFLINSMKVARLDMLAGSDGVPASAFAPDAVHPPIENPILPAGSQVTVIVENVDGADHAFYGNFFGIDLTPAHARVV